MLCYCRRKSIFDAYVVCIFIGVLCLVWLMSFTQDVDFFSKLLYSHVEFFLTLITVLYQAFQVLYSYVEFYSRWLEYWFRSLTVLRSINAERLFHRFVYLDIIPVGGENVLQKNDSSLLCLQIYYTTMYRIVFGVASCQYFLFPCFIILIAVIKIPTCIFYGAWGSVVVKALRY